VTAHRNERRSEQQQRYGGVGAETDPAEIDLESGLVELISG